MGAECSTMTVRRMANSSSWCFTNQVPEDQALLSSISQEAHEPSEKKVSQLNHDVFENGQEGPCDPFSDSQSTVLPEGATSPTSIQSYLSEKSLLIDVSDVVFQRELCSTCKSKVFVAGWRGQLVAAKQLKMDPEGLAQRKKTLIKKWWIG